MELLIFFNTLNSLKLKCTYNSRRLRKPRRWSKIIVHFAQIKNIEFTELEISGENSEIHFSRIRENLFTRPAYNINETSGSLLISRA